MIDTHDLIQLVPVEVSERAIKELLDIDESLHQRVQALEANNRATKTERGAVSEWRIIDWVEELQPLIELAEITTVSRLSRLVRFQRPFALMEEINRLREALNKIEFYAATGCLQDQRASNP